MPWLLLFPMAVFLLGACQSRPAAKKQSPSPDAVAEIGGKPVTASDLEAELSRRPAAAHRRFATQEGKQALLDDFIERRLMLAEAERLGLPNEPRLKRKIEQLLIDELARREVDEKTDADDVTMDEAASFYREHQSDFAKPEAVRVRQILVADAKIATRLTIAARQMRSKPGAFERLVEQNSIDAASKGKGGDLGFVEEEGSPYSPTVIAAAFALKKPGDVSSPIETNQGFHVLSLVERRPAAIQPFAEAEAAVRARLYRERRKQRFESWISGLRALANVKVHAARLAAVESPHQAAASSPGPQGPSSAP